MKMYEVFKSEGGYRVCLASWGDDPLLAKNPWFKTIEEAETVAKKAKFRDETKDMRMFWGNGG